MSYRLVSRALILDAMTSCRVLVAASVLASCKEPVPIPVSGPAPVAVAVVAPLPPPAVPTTAPEPVVTGSVLHYVGRRGDAGFRRGNITQVGISRTGIFGVTAASTGTIATWDLRSGALLQTIETGGGSTSRVAISDNGRLLAAVVQDQVQVWNVASARRSEPRSFGVTSIAPPSTPRPHSFSSSSSSSPPSCASSTRSPVACRAATRRRGRGPTIRRGW